MNQRLMTILMTAFLIAAAAAYGVYRYAGATLRTGYQGQTTPVLVAAHDIELGAVIRPADVRVSQWIGALPKGAVTKLENATDRGVISSLSDGEPILESRLAPVGSGGGLAATIKPGMRACAVRVNDIVGVAGFAVPGMRVDVLIAGNAPGNTTQGARVKTLLQNIEVLSAGANFQKDQEGKPVQVQVVNLLVTPEQAEVLSLASNETRIQLVLRNPLDNEVSKAPGAAVAGLFGEAAPPPVIRYAPAPRPVPVIAVAAPAAPKPVLPQYILVEVLNGNKRTEAKFDDPKPGDKSGQAKSPETGAKP